MGVEDCKEVGGERGGVWTTDKVCVVVPGLEKLGAAKGSTLKSRTGAQADAANQQQLQCLEKG